MKVMLKSLARCRTVSSVLLCFGIVVPPIKMPSLWFRQWRISPKILYISLSNKSCDYFALNINLLGLIFPHGVLNVARALDSG